MPKKGGMKTEELDLEPIMEPHEHDVLCGRGGLTNHHPGNAWYRRLVRSNRPLYRDSPKHTKLLVAKAIVHHVQNQTPSGRFLERKSTTSGVWYTVSYKRAVDKTSQALREKDRENEGIADEKILQKVNKPPPVVANGSTVPSADFLKYTHVNHPGQQPTALSNDENICAPPPTKVQRTSSWFWRQPRNQDPLPPQQGLVSRVSSMFRFMQGTPLLNNQQSSMGNMGGAHNITYIQSNMTGLNGANNMNGLGGGNTMNNFAMNPPVNNHENTINSTPEYNFGTKSSSDLLEPVPLGNSMMANNNNTNEMNRKRSADEAGLQSNNGTAPPLTRMATQVSDWLSTFWPVGNEMKGEKETTGNQQTAEQLQAQILQMQEQLRRNNELLQQNGINADDSSLSKNAAVASIASVKLEPQPAGNFGAAAQNNSSSNLDAENQIRMQMQQLHERMQQSTNDDSTEPLPGPLSPGANTGTAPPSLAANVSSSIFQLASTPSRLLSGFSSFFTSNNPERRSSQAAVMAAAGIDGEGEDSNMKGSSTLSDWIGDSESGVENAMNDLEKGDGTSAMPADELMPAPSMGMSRSLGGDGSTNLPEEDDALPSFGRRTSNRSLLEDDDD